MLEYRELLDDLGRKKDVHPRTPVVVLLEFAPQFPQSFLLAQFRHIAPL